MRYFSIFLGVLSVLILAACQDESLSDEPLTYTLDFTLDTLVLEVGERQDVALDVSDTVDLDAVVFTSSDESIVTYEAGEVIALAVGSATLTATYESVSASLEIDVEAAPVLSVFNVDLPNLFQLAETVEDALLLLPSTVEVYDQFDTVHVLPVTFDEASLSLAGEAEYFIDGTVELPDNFDEATYVFTALFSLVRDDDIVITDLDVLNLIDDIEVPEGTLEAALKALLETTISVQDSAGSRYTLDLVWDLSDYDSEAGTYVLTATIIPLDNMTLTDDTVNIEVFVLAEPDVLVAIDTTEITPLEVPNGATYAAVIDLLEPTLTIETAQGAFLTVDVQWRSDDYDANAAGAYTFTGTFELPNDVNNDPDNPFDLSVQVMVTVLEAVSQSTYTFVNNTSVIGYYEYTFASLDFAIDTLEIGEEGFDSVRLEIVYDDDRARLFEEEGVVLSSGESLASLSTLSADSALSFSLEVFFDEAGNHTFTVNLIDAMTGDLLATEAIMMQARLTDPIADAYTVGDGTEMTVSGVVTQIVTDGFYIQNEDGRGIFVFDLEGLVESKGIELNDFVFLQASTVEDRLRTWLAFIETLNVVEKGVALPEAIDITVDNLDTVFSQWGQLFNFTDLFFQETIFYDDYFLVILGDLEGDFIRLYIDGNDPEYETYRTYFNALVFGQKVSLVNVVSERNTYFTSLDQITATPLDEAALRAHIDDVYGLESIIYDSFDAPTSIRVFDKVYDLNWLSSNETVIDTTGSVFRPSVDDTEESLQIEIEITLGDVTYASLIYDVTVPIFDPEAYELLYSFDFENYDRNFTDFSYGALFDLDHGSAYFSTTQETQFPIQMIMTMDEDDQFRDSQSLRLALQGTSQLRLNNVQFSHLGKIEVALGGYAFDGSAVGYQIMLIQYDEETGEILSSALSDTVYSIPSVMTTVTHFIDYDDFEGIDETMLVGISFMFMLTRDFDSFEERAVNFDDFYVYRKPR